MYFVATYNFFCQLQQCFDRQRNDFCCRFATSNISQIYQRKFRIHQEGEPRQLQNAQHRGAVGVVGMAAI